MDGNTADFIGNQFNRNTAGGDYGALYMADLDDGTLMRFWDNEVVGNRAGITETAYVNGQVVSAPVTVLGGDGGGLWFESVEYGSESHLQNNLILSNTAYVTGTGGGSYGGLFADLDSHSGLLTMIDNTIEGNAAQDSYGGVAIELYDASRVVMEHNLIGGNTAITESGGVAIYGADDSQYFLRRNQILDNRAGSKDGLWLENGDATEPLWGVSENNLIAGNQGSGVTLQDVDFWSTNDTIADNVDYGLMMTGTVTSTAYVSNSVVWGHAASFARSSVVTYTDRFTMAVTYPDVEGGWPGTGNIDEDPLFVGGGDYHLQAGSPAVDAAETAAAPSVDLDGVPRPIPAGGDADMGGYEWFRAGVTLEEDQLSTELPGTMVTYTLTITNDGHLPDTFLLDTPINTMGWTVAVVPSSVSLASGGSASVGVAVTVPTDATGGAVNDLTVRVVSGSDDSVIDVATIETTVANVAGVGLRPDRAGDVAPGSMVRYEHTLTNDGNFTDTISLSASSTQGWPVAVVPPVANVAAGGSTTVVVSVTVPAGTAAGVVDSMVVTATSSTTEGTTTDSATDTSTVIRVAGVGIAPDNSSFAVPGSTAVYTHTVTNAGNAADVFSLAAISSQGWAVQVTPSTLSLSAGASDEVQVALTVPTGVSDATDVTTVSVTSGYNSSVSDSATDTTRTEHRIYLPLVRRN